MACSKAQAALADSKDHLVARMPSDIRHGFSPMGASIIIQKVTENADCSLLIPLCLGIAVVTQSV